MREFLLFQREMKEHSSESTHTPPSALSQLLVCTTDGDTQLFKIQDFVNITGVRRDAMAQRTLHSTSETQRTLLSTLEEASRVDPGPIPFRGQGPVSSEGYNASSEMDDRRGPLDVKLGGDIRARGGTSGDESDSDTDMRSAPPTPEPFSRGAQNTSTSEERKSTRDPRKDSQIPRSGSGFLGDTGGSGQKESPHITIGDVVDTPGGFEYGNTAVGSDRMRDGRMRIRESRGSGTGRGERDEGGGAGTRTEMPLATTENNLPLESVPKNLLQNIKRQKFLNDQRIRLEEELRVAELEAERRREEADRFERSSSRDLVSGSRFSTPGLNSSKVRHVRV
jgi:hypothetical protein